MQRRRWTTWGPAVRAEPDFPDPLATVRGGEAAGALALCRGEWCGARAEDSARTPAQSPRQAGRVRLSRSRG